MAYRLEHPFSGAVYCALDDGRVEVSNDGRSGIFDHHGAWVSGELRTADAELCRWVGTHTFTSASRHLAGFTEPSIGSAAGGVEAPGVEAERPG